MNLPPAVLDLAADAVAAWATAGTAVRDALAALPGLRRLPAAERAATAQLAAAAVGQQRRLRWLLGEPLPVAGAPAPAAAPRLVAAAALAAGLGPAPFLATWLARRRAAAGGLAAVAGPAAAARLAAIADPALRFAVAASLPDWLAARLQAALGAAAAPFAAALAEPPPRTLRANLLRVADRAALAAELAAAAVPTAPAAFAPHALHAEGPADLFATAAFQRGAFEQQDEASQLAAWLVAPPPRGRVLDACAGRGGKTLALAAALGNRGEVLAADVHQGRLQELQQRARRAGASNVRAVPCGAADWPPEVAAFAARADRVLLDVPCSGSGALRRRPEGRWAVAAERLPELLATQQQLLARAAAALQPGARLVYATCSVLPEENERQVEALLAEQPALELVPAKEVLGAAAAQPLADPAGRWLQLRPDRHGCDGFFAAVLRRRRAGA